MWLDLNPLFQNWFNDNQSFVCFVADTRDSMSALWFGVAGGNLHTFFIPQTAEAWVRQTVSSDGEGSEHSWFARS